MGDANLENERLGGVAIAPAPLKKSFSIFRVFLNGYIAEQTVERDVALKLRPIPTNLPQFKKERRLKSTTYKWYLATTFSLKFTQARIPQAFNLQFFLFLRVLGTIDCGVFGQRTSLAVSTARPDLAYFDSPLEGLPTYFLTLYPSRQSKLRENHSRWCPLGPA